MSSQRLVRALCLISLLAWSCSGRPLSNLPTAPVDAELELDLTPDPAEVELAASWGLFRQAHHYPSEVPVAWFNLAYELVKAERWSPPVASRAFGYAGVALYEAVVPGMPHHRTLARQLNELDRPPIVGSFASHWPAAANRALATVFSDLFVSGSPATQASIDSLYEKLNTQFRAELPRLILALSNLRGERVGEAINDWAHTDGFLEYNNCTYTPPSGEGLWVPTPPAFAPALQPCWGQLRSFCMVRNDQCDPGPHPAYSEVPGSAFYLEAREVYDVASNLTPEQLVIANYWADNPGATGTPPGHSISIATQILVQEGSRLDLAAETYAKVGIGVADAFISCWWSKYEYNLLRPVTYARELFQADWIPPVATPPFPEYTSGHSVQSGATAQILFDLFGDVPFVDHTHDGAGFAPRSFSTFAEFADEAAISRLYGGIHFRSAIDLGVDQGRLVGQLVSGLKFHKGRRHWAFGRP